MNWRFLQLSTCNTHHVDECGRPAYDERFDNVLKFHPPGLAPVSHKGRAWHVRSDGAPAYDRKFSMVFGFYEGVAAVVGPDGWHHITTDGRDAYSERYDWCGNFQQGRCTVREKGGDYHHITHSGSAAYPSRWRYAGDYRDGIAVAQATDGRSTHIDLNGKLVHGNWFTDLDVFHKGFARARDENGWMHVNIQGRPVYAGRFRTVEPFYNGQARVERFDGALEVVDEGGKTIVLLRPALRSEFADLSGDMVGFWRTQAIAAAVELGVIEALPATEAEVADRCRLRGDGAWRLLRALSELGIVAWLTSRWTLTRRGEFLRADHPLTLADAAIEYAGPFSAMWNRLPEALRQDSKWRTPDIFGEIAQNKVRCTGHHRMLQSYARHDYAEVCNVLDLHGDERVVDAGGGLGVLARMVLDAHPSVEVTILERPEVVAMAHTSVPGLFWRSGSLFEPWGLNADTVLLSRVLHDWDDSEAIQILTHARATLPRGGRIYIIELLVSGNSASGSLCDLHLFMVTGGRERSVEQFRQMLSATKFELADVRRIPALPSVIVGVAL